MRHSWLYGCLDDVGGARDNRGRYETSGGARPNGVATLGRAPNVSDMESTSPVEPAGKAGAVSAGASTTGVAWARQNTQSCPTGTFVWECGRTAPIPTATNAARGATRRTFCHPEGFMGGSFSHPFLEKAVQKFLRGAERRSMHLGELLLELKGL